MISDEAVEAAAKVLCEQLWENAHESQRAYARDEAREALEAAAPHMVLVELNTVANVPAEQGLTRTELAQVLEEVDAENNWDVSPDMYRKYAEAILAEADSGYDVNPEAVALRMQARLAQAWDEGAEAMCDCNGWATESNPYRRDAATDCPPRNWIPAPRVPGWGILEDRS